MCSYHREDRVYIWAGDTMNWNPFSKINFLHFKTASRIILLYIFLGIIWIVFSDRIVMALIDDAPTLTFLQTIKGGLFVTVTSVGLFFIIYSQLREISKRQDEQRFYERKADFLMNFDSLTGLPNRNLLNNFIEAELTAHVSHQKMLAIYNINLDHFKRINDSLGFTAGDTLLTQISQRLLAYGNTNDMLARIGGDAFILVQTGIGDSGQAVESGEKLIELFQQPFSVDKHDIFMTVSIGIAIYPNHGDSCDELLNHAEIAMHQAKKLGRNSVRLYSADMMLWANDRFMIQNDLHQAIERGELELYYQPQLSVRGNKIAGVEALIRWNHPKKGVIPPDVFIPLAEESGLIVEIDQWVMRTACRQNRRWQEKGLLYVPIAVNLSVIQFRSDSLIPTLKSILAETSLDAKYLKLEITEQIAMDNQYSVRILEELRSMGIAVSIDDFGTGYSSLQYLKDFPIQEMKIDRSFINGVIANENDAAIVRTIIAMARSLNLSVVAEGVELEEQLAFLRDNGCDEFQGYYISPPVPVKSFEELCRNL